MLAQGFLQPRTKNGEKCWTCAPVGEGRAMGMDSGRLPSERETERALERTILQAFGSPRQVRQASTQKRKKKETQKRMPSLDCRSESHVLDAAAALVLHGLAQLFLAGRELRPFCLGAEAAGFQFDVCRGWVGIRACWRPWQNKAPVVRDAQDSTSGAKGESSEEKSAVLIDPRPNSSQVRCTI